MLDDSGSMSGTQWNNLKKCTDDFIDELVSNPDLKNNCKLSVIIYNSYSRIVIENEVPDKTLKNRIVY